MPKKTLAWLGMTLLAVAVAGYAGAIVIAPELRPPLVRSLFADWPIAAPVHFAGGAVALAVGAFQLNSRIRARFIAIHRWLGRTYLLAVAAGGVASLVLAVHSSAAPVARVGFGLLGVFWLVSTFNAYRYIRQGEVGAHRNWMIRSYALTLAAVTLRLYLPLSLIAGVPFTIAYPPIAWVCWVPNLLVAEWLVRSGRSSFTMMTTLPRARPVSR
ncbi:MAG: DUF2306 domain-containing protein [Steroidobacteraceae bacterium]